jgi:1-deoxy-D-xylulose-5-phosphate synthase
MLIQPGKILAKIDSPDDIKKLNQTQLTELCDDLRQFIIDNVSVYGGHFGASLGVVEMTVALHYVFNTPDDQLVWDVGHQAYGHKILTGRRDQFHSNRTYKGLSGFPKRSESAYDAFGVGHSSTSISAGLGMAIASEYKNEKGSTSHSRDRRWCHDRRHGLRSHEPCRGFQLQLADHTQ